MLLSLHISTSICYFPFSALMVRYVTRRFIGDYDPTLGKQASSFVLCELWFTGNEVGDGLNFREVNSIGLRNTNWPRCGLKSAEHFVEGWKYYNVHRFEDLHITYVVRDLYGMLKTSLIKFSPERLWLFLEISKKRTKHF